VVQNNGGSTVAQCVVQAAAAAGLRSITICPERSDWDHYSNHMQGLGASECVADRPACASAVASLSTRPCAHMRRWLCPIHTAGVARCFCRPPDDALAFPPPSHRCSRRTGANGRRWPPPTYAPRGFTPPLQPVALLAPAHPVPAHTGRWPRLDTSLVAHAPIAGSRHAPAHTRRCQRFPATATRTRAVASDFPPWPCAQAPSPATSRQGPAHKRRLPLPTHAAVPHWCRTEPSCAPPTVTAQQRTISPPPPSPPSPPPCSGCGERQGSWQGGLPQGDG
jgi:hypothetical protein